MPLVVHSSAFADGQPIPRKFTCDGQDVSPPLGWREHPDGTRSFAVICDDPDAPAGTFTHWVLYDVPSDVTDLAEGSPGVGREGVNSFGRPGYSGPCPPPPRPHRYIFHVYALKVQSLGAAGMTKVDAMRALAGHVLAEGRLVGTYARAARAK
jgi:hypothetical protein